MSYKRILVPVDGSSVSNLGLKQAMKMARGGRAKVRLLHVVEEFGAFMTPDTGASIGPVLDSLRAAGKRTLARIERRARASGLKPSTALVENFAGRVADAIVDEVKRWRPDLVIMGTHGRRGIKRMLLGSDAELVIRSSPVPVLLVPAARR
ncbi:MAG TPA: universal stress protein [Burkholderiales bacterium]|jgi:nucleotide-binding universal stress UspA family protein|nr:universal stress protein [Burkholderiales bacterium]